MMTDDALARFALGVASSVGVMLAVLVSIFVFLINRWAIDGRAALGQLITDANSVYFYVYDRRDVTVRYMGDESTYVDFAGLISTLAGGTRSLDDVPNFIEWRRNTAKITRAAITFSNARVQTDSNAEGATSQKEQDLSIFHEGFVPLMKQLDDAIQSSDWAKEQLRQARRASLITYLAGIALVSSLLVALSAEIQVRSGIANGLNVWGASFLIIIVLALVVSIFIFTKFAWTTRETWIGRRVRTFLKSIAKAD